MSRHGIPEVVFEKIDAYVDSLAPQIQPQISREIDTFQKITIDSLEDKVVDAFRSLFDKNHSSGSRGLDEDAPDAYGTQSLAFADELVSITRSLTNLSGGAKDDIQQIFNLTERSGGGGQRGVEEASRDVGHSDSFRGFLSAAVDAIKEHSEPGSGGGGPRFELDGLLGVISNQVKEATRNPEEKARAISPDIKEKVGAMLREKHAPLAEQLTKIALDHIKKWLRGNTSTRDLGDGLKGEITDMVSSFAGMFGKKKHEQEGSSRGIDDRDDGAHGDAGGSGFSGVISKKLSTGLANVHREVRLEFRKVFGGIEKGLFEALPDQFQRPLEKLLGGNPFDESLGTSHERGFGDDIKTKLVDKIRNLVRKVQETLRESILSIVNGGHRKLERQSWMFVQEKVQSKVQKFLPDVRITVPDDIGNEGVSVGKPQESAHLPPPSQGHSAATITPQHYQQPYNPGSEHHQHQQPSHYSNQPYNPGPEHSQPQQSSHYSNQPYHGGSEYQQSEQPHYSNQPHNAASEYYQPQQSSHYSNPPYNSGSEHSQHQQQQWRQ